MAKALSLISFFMLSENPLGRRRSSLKIPAKKSPLNPALATGLRRLVARLPYDLSRSPASARSLVRAGISGSYAHWRTPVECGPDVASTMTRWGHPSGENHDET